MDSKKTKKKTKEEIAREFDLPERKSKIDSMTMKQEYCICRSTDSDRFMIGCDNCDNWYHGDCINVTEKEAKHIKHYYCQKCREENPDLRTIFRIIPVQEKEPVSEVKSNQQKDPSFSEKHDLPVKEEKPKKIKKIKPPKEKSKKRKRSVTPEIFINPELTGLRQCYGPMCKKNARTQSKYCSDTCGLVLASKRIFQILPQRLQEWNFSQCKAELENTRQLEENLKKQNGVKMTLKNLEERHNNLDNILELVKTIRYDSQAKETTEAEDEQSMYCITCGHEIHSKTAIRHMEKCFNKYESQSSFGSVFQTKMEGRSMFCDYYNPASKTYCKRLRVLCPEHSKAPKVSETDVCGCPLTDDLINKKEDFCRVQKKSCFKHHMWEKIRRAEIDMECVRQMMKIDELLEQERQIRYSMTSRAGVLGLLLHSTYNHDLIEELRKQQQLQKN